MQKMKSEKTNFFRTLGLLIFLSSCFRVQNRNREKSSLFHIYNGLTTTVLEGKMKAAERSSEGLCRARHEGACVLPVRKFQKTSKFENNEKHELNHCFGVGTHKM